MTSVHEARPSLAKNLTMPFSGNYDGCFLSSYNQIEFIFYILVTCMDKGMHKMLLNTLCVAAFPVCSQP